MKDLIDTGVKLYLIIQGFSRRGAYLYTLEDWSSVKAPLRLTITQDPV